MFKSRPALGEMLPRLKSLPPRYDFTPYPTHYKSDQHIKLDSYFHLMLTCIKDQIKALKFRRNASGLFIHSDTIDFLMKFRSSFAHLPIVSGVFLISICTPSIRAESPHFGGKPLLKSEPIGKISEIYAAKSLPDSTNCTPVPMDILSWWRSEGTANDEVGTNTGVVSNGLSFVSGVVGKAFSFDGFDDCVIVPNTASLNIGPGQDFAIEGWIKAEFAVTPFGIQTIVDKRLSPNFVTATGYSLHLGEGSLGCQLGASGTGYTTFQTSGRDLRDGQWHHVALAVIRNSASGGKLYVDGQAVLVFDPTSQTGDLTTSEPFRIGDHADPALNCHFKGLIDELSVYRRALSAAEIARIYEAGSAGKCTGPVCAPPALGLVSWWPAESNAADVINGNPGTIGPGVTFVNGKVGQAFSFNSVGARVALVNATNLQLQNFTLEAWVKRTSVTKATWDVYDHGLIVAGPWGSYGMGLLDSGHLFLSCLGVSSVSSTNRIADTNEFHHVAVTKNGASVVLYIDGNPETMPAYNPTFSFNGPLAIGTRGTDFAVTFRGHIDEPSVYARALSAQEIQAIVTAGSLGKCQTSVAPALLSQPAEQASQVGGTASFSVNATGSQPLFYQWRHQGNDLFARTNSILSLTNVQLSDAGQYSVRVWNSAGSIASSNALLTVQPAPANCSPTAPGLVSWWPGDGDATDIIDGNSGTVGPGVTFVPGKVQKAFSFNSSGARVTLPTATNLQLQDFTMEAWVKRTSATKATWDVFDHGLIIAGPWGSYGMGLLDNGRLFLSCLGVSSVATTNRITDTDSFHHVAVTKHGGNVVLYIDGVSETMPPYSPTFSFNGPLAIGTRGTDFAVTFRGHIDEPGIYARALTAQEVLAIVTAGDLGKCRGSVPPAILAQPVDQASLVGGDVNFSVGATGSQPLFYQWRHQGNDLFARTNSILS